MIRLGGERGAERGGGRETDTNGQFAVIDLLRYLWPICLNRVQTNRTNSRRRRLTIYPSAQRQAIQFEFDTIAP